MDAFPYPAMPDTLRTVPERAQYLMRHYWDGIDFGDTTLIQRQNVTEIGFVNFIDLLPRVDSVFAAEGVAAFGRRVYSEGVPHTVRAYYADLASRYLDSQDSPMRNERSYIMLLEALASAVCNTDNVTADGYRYLVSNLRKNQTGHRAADFKLVDRKGNRRTLYGLESEYTVLFFYDPDCDNCHRIAAQLANEPLLVSDQRIKVLAIYADADTDAWKAHSAPFPQTWTDGHSPDGEVASRQIYFIRSFPSIYLLDSQKRVILKDVTAEQLIEKLHTLSAANSDNSIK